MNKKKLLWLMIGSLMLFLTIISAVNALMVVAPSKLFVSEERLVNGSIIVYDLKGINDLSVKSNDSLITFFNQRLFDEDSLIIDYSINNSGRGIGYFPVNVSLLSEGETINSFLIKVYFQNDWFLSIKKIFLEKSFLGLNPLLLIIISLSLLLFVSSSVVKNFLSFLVSQVRSSGLANLLLVFFLSLLIIGSSLFFFSDELSNSGGSLIVKEFVINDYVNQGPGLLVISRDNRTPSFADYVTFSNGFQKDYFVINDGSGFVKKELFIKPSDLLTSGNYYFLVKVYDVNGLVSVVPFKVVL